MICQDIDLSAYNLHILNNQNGNDIPYHRKVRIELQLKKIGVLILTFLIEGKVLVL